MAVAPETYSTWAIEVVFSQLGVCLRQTDWEDLYQLLNNVGQNRRQQQSELEDIDIQFEEDEP